MKISGRLRRMMAAAIVVRRGFGRAVPDSDKEAMRLWPTPTCPEAALLIQAGGGGRWKVEGLYK